jgi:multiple sugar transport system permease protein
MLIPSFFIIAMVFLYPVVKTISLSFYKFTLISPTEYLGFRNYSYIFQDPVFYQTVLRNVVYVVIVVTANVIVGMGFALLTYRDYPGSIVLRTIFILPMLFIPATSAVMWSMLLDENIGLVNHIIKFFGFKAHMWLVEPGAAFAWILVADIWSWTPFMYLSLLAGMRDLPKDPYEAAMLDGANAVQQFWFITVPLMRGIIGTAVILKSLATFRTFNYTWVMTKGGPGDSTQVLSTLTYWEGIMNYRYGYASAMATVILIISLILSMLLVIYFKRRGQQ